MSSAVYSRCYDNIWTPRGEKTPDSEFVFSARPAHGRRLCRADSPEFLLSLYVEGSGGRWTGKCGTRVLPAGPAAVAPSRYQGSLERQQSHTILQHSYATGGFWHLISTASHLGFTLFRNVSAVCRF